MTSVETKRTKSRPPGPFITSTMQQAASSRLGFNAQRTMRTAQRLYEGIEVKGEGAVGLITYMRTDSTHLSGDALDMAARTSADSTATSTSPRSPTSSAAPTSPRRRRTRPSARPPWTTRPRRSRAPSPTTSTSSTASSGTASSPARWSPAEWDSTTVLLEGGTDDARPVTFRANGRVLAFDGFYRVAGVPTASDEQTLPRLEENDEPWPFSLEPSQRFSSPPPRYTEASLIKTLEAEGIGRPSTYASIISVIQDRNYVEQMDRRFYATDLGEVVTDKLMEGFPEIMELGYTRDMEAELDRIEDDHLNWVDVLEEFYGPFKRSSSAPTRTWSTPRRRPSPPRTSTAARSAARRPFTASEKAGDS